MKRNLVTAVLMTIATTMLFGIIYPFVVTALAQLLFPNHANGQLIRRGDQDLGPSNGYSLGLGINASGLLIGAIETTSQAVAQVIQYLLDHREWLAKARSAAQSDNPNVPVPADLVTASGSGLDPDISPAAAYFQVPRVARARAVSDQRMRELVASHIQPRTIAIFGEPRVNVVELNLALDRMAGK